MLASLAGPRSVKVKPSPEIRGKENEDAEA